ncbi:hypothetical protein HDU97_005619 [Phlyctochytrium planicorne]|nr:hypothetical protein HDU97_005619 [Phlyctochytrium planicorne]
MLKSSLRRTILRSLSTNSNNSIIPQAQNRPGTWSAHQESKIAATTGPRFEQTNMELQPNPLAAIELIKKVPIQKVHSRRVACDGGGGALGHPKVYINLDQGEPVGCGYCGQRFQKIDDHHH